MSEENFYPDGHGTETEEQTSRVSLEKPNQESDRGDAAGGQGIYKETINKMQGEYHQTAGDSEFGYRQDGIYGQNASGQDIYQVTPVQPVSQGFGIASMVLGILSLILFCTCINIPLAIMAIVFGILQLAKPEAPKGMAAAGIVTSVISLILFVISIIAFVLSADFQEGFQNGLQGNFYEEYFNEYRIPHFDGDDDEEEYNDPFDGYDEDFTF